MKIGILANPPDLSNYVAEIFKTWGLVGFDRVRPDQVDTLDPASTPVLVCPASEQNAKMHESLIGFARRGGVLIVFLPTGALADAAGLVPGEPKPTPLRLRISVYPAAGLAGEDLPVVGEARVYNVQAGAGVGLAYLYHPERFEGETVGAIETPVEKGRIVAFAFDLPRCVLTLRQGDPDQVEQAIEGNVRADSIGIDLGPADSGLFPFADLLARWLVDLVRRCMPAPAPMLWHLPGGAPAIVLYSGDEDGAEVSWVEEEFREVTAAGARMNLYIIPIHTHSTSEDVQRYLQDHDVGPHPNLRPLDGRPISDRVAEFERQLLLFEKMFGFKPKSVRNHCLSWAGYLDLVEVEARLGIRMDANYLCSAYMQDRCTGPYHLRGAAMPMRFCHPDGRMIDVIQQHTHLSDDVWFHPTAPKSFRYSPAQYGVLVDRILDDSGTRFHTPYGVIMHPSNWVNFSGKQGLTLLKKAVKRHIPIWSYDQWCDFWLLRDQWHIENLSWEDNTLKFKAGGPPDDGNLRWLIPGRFSGRRLAEVAVDGETVPCEPVTRYGRCVTLVPLSEGKEACDIQAIYS